SESGRIDPGPGARSAMCTVSSTSGVAPNSFENRSRISPPPNVKCTTWRRVLSASPGSGGRFCGSTNCGEQAHEPTQVEFSFANEDGRIASMPAATMDPRKKRITQPLDRIPTAGTMNTERTCRCPRDDVGALLLPGSLLLDKPEVSTGVQHVHDVEHAIEIPLVPNRDRCSPEFGHKRLLVRSRGRGQPSCRGRGQHSSRMARGERLAIQRIAIREGADALADEELLDAVAQHPLLRRLMPPAIVHRPVAHRPPRIVAERSRLAVATQNLGLVEVVAVRRQAGIRSYHLGEHVAAHIRSLGPVLAVFLRTPAGEQLVKSGQMIRRVRGAGADACGKARHVIVWFHHWAAGSRTRRRPYPACPAKTAAAESAAAKSSAARRRLAFALPLDR